MRAPGDIPGLSDGIDGKLLHFRVLVLHLDMQITQSHEMNVGCIRLRNFADVTNQFSKTQNRTRICSYHSTNVDLSG